MDDIGTHSGPCICRTTLLFWSAMAIVSVPGARAVSKATLVTCDVDSITGSSKFVPNKLFEPPARVTVEAVATVISRMAIPFWSATTTNAPSGDHDAEMGYQNPDLVPSW